jgi:N-acetyl-gamma-glutamylphosphate reductase
MATIRVRATKAGTYRAGMIGTVLDFAKGIQVKAHVNRSREAQPGDVFEIDEKAFSKNWMVKIVDKSAPEPVATVPVAQVPPADKKT